MFNCGATLQQSSDLFYQKFLKIESKILPLPASAAAARKRGLRGKGIAAAASAFARPAIRRGLLLAKFFDSVEENTPSSIFEEFPFLEN